MKKQLLVLVLGLIAFGFFITSNANTYIVGDNSGWDISTNLDTWAQNKKFVVGDVLCNHSFPYPSYRIGKTCVLLETFKAAVFSLTNLSNEKYLCYFMRGETHILVFQYSSTESVCEVGEESFQTCNTTNVINCHNDGNTSIPLTTPGERYFFCGNRLYCYSGMKLDVIVERNQSAMAEAPLSGVPEAETGGSKNNNPSTVVPNDGVFVGVGLDSFLVGVLGFLGIWISII